MSKFRYKYFIGCDGGRRTMAIPFNGTSSEDKGVGVDGSYCLVFVDMVQASEIGSFVVEAVEHSSLLSDLRNQDILGFITIFRNHSVCI
ncbi:hypothetical protein AC579_7250 [Pseudocercospora musae]|uniref:FAD-binding domain-containing protein n=1 Tax=Pseudocercospora musae TaxID=113226 RepID=A0A139IF25_9PEZI|nr:hypothetical protein AC579_7250 [Pseudocercospora musae]